MCVTSSKYRPMPMSPSTTHTVPGATGGRMRPHCVPTVWHRWFHSPISKRMTSPVGIQSIPATIWLMANIFLEVPSWIPPTLLLQPMLQVTVSLWADSSSSIPVSTSIWNLYLRDCTCVRNMVLTMLLPTTRAIPMSMLPMNRYGPIMRVVIWLPV